jgi:hypothetical protein
MSSQKSKKNKSFVSDKDLVELKKHGINFIEYEKVFLKELKDFLIKTWRSEFHKELKDLEKKSIKDFNKIICDYPSWGGYHILEDTFNENIDLLSDKTQNLIGYFYGIHLR